MGTDVGTRGAKDPEPHPDVYGQLVLLRGAETTLGKGEPCRRALGGHGTRPGDGGNQTQFTPGSKTTSRWTHSPDVSAEPSPSGR